MLSVAGAELGRDRHGHRMQRAAGRKGLLPATTYRPKAELLTHARSALSPRSDPVLQAGGHLGAVQRGRHQPHDGRVALDEGEVLEPSLDLAPFAALRRWGS